MSLEYLSKEEAEKGLCFLKNGLPEEAAPVYGGEFLGYYHLVRELNGKKVKLTYEPDGKTFLFRNALVLQ